MPEPQQGDFGARVREHLKKKGLSFEAAAEKSNEGVSYGTVRSMARNVPPNPEKILAFVEATTDDQEEYVELALDLLTRAESRVAHLLDALQVRRLSELFGAREAAYH